MRIVQINAQRDPQARDPAALLDAWPTLVDAAAAVARTGAQVMVIQAAHEQKQLERQGVLFEFVPAQSRAPALLAAVAARHEPDIVHLHGLHFPEHLEALVSALPAIPLVVQDHANVLPRYERRSQWRRALQHAAGMVFTSRLQALPFLRADIITDRTRIFAVPESSTHFQLANTAAPNLPGLAGDPLIAWVGRLDRNKDPLTLLRGFVRVLNTLPQARLTMCFREAPLYESVLSFVQRQGLQDRVHLLGALPHAQVEQLLQVADFFVSASHSESTGYALIEALACGVTPVVSDIPSYRALLGNGAAGALFRPGDDAALARELIRAAGMDRSAERAAVRQHFDHHLSFDALGRRWAEVYQALLTRRSDLSTGAVASTAHTTRVSAASTAARPVVALVVPGGVDRSGRERVIPCLLWLIERLARQAELHVIALRQEPHFTTYELLGAAVHCLPAPASRARVLRELLRLHRQFDFQVWHALWMHPQGTLAGLAGRITRRPVLLHINGGDLAALPDIHFGGRATARGRFWLQLAVRLASHITVPSLAMQRAAHALGIDAEVLTLGVATDRWPLRAPQARTPAQPVRLLHVANLNRVKDQPTLLRALAALRARGVAFHADLIGEDTLNGEIQRLAAQLGLHDHIEFHGALAHDTTRAFYDAAHVFVLSSRHEADPIVALEAALAGVPTAGTCVGHLIDWSPDAAVTAAVGDADGLANAIQMLLDDDARRCMCARHAQQRALAMDADRGAARVLELYRRLAAV